MKRTGGFSLVWGSSFPIRRSFRVLIANRTQKGSFASENAACVLACLKEKGAATSRTKTWGFRSFEDLPGPRPVSLRSEDHADLGLASCTGVKIFTTETPEVSERRSSYKAGRARVGLIRIQHSTELKTTSEPSGCCLAPPSPEEIGSSSQNHKSEQVRVEKILKNENSPNHHKSGIGGWHST